MSPADNPKPDLGVNEGPRPRRGKKLALRLFLVIVPVAAGLIWWFQPDPGDRRLRQFVAGRPPVPVVFTSRSETASFHAAAPSGLGYTFPGQPHWQAREGRLRLLTPRGTVHELTWGRPLPDGDLIIDVMSPSVSPDGKKIVFAGRRQGDHRRFRIFAVNVNGRGLIQHTGGSDDPGTTAPPPMRYKDKNGEAWPGYAQALHGLASPDQAVELALAALAGPQLMTNDERARVDFDDVDPVYLNDGSIAFISSRIPDLGRGHARRATQLWIMNPDGSKKRPITSNRNSDRWPFQLASGFLAFSEWSRNTEVITEDLTDIQPYHEGLAAATKPTDMWQGLRVAPNGDQFGLLVKLPYPVWRPRPLFNGKVAFMTDMSYGKHEGDPGHARLQVWQAPMHLVANSASAVGRNEAFPKQRAGLLHMGPTHDASGRPLVLATPSPCPDHNVLFSGAVLKPGQTIPEARQFGLFLADENWDGDADTPVAAASVHLRPLFDDPDFVDAEPVAVYARTVEGHWADLTANLPGSTDELQIELANGETYRGRGGQIVNGDLYLPAKEKLPGQLTDAEQGPIVREPPVGLINELRFFASYRDRFDHPFEPRVVGSWKLLVKAPVQAGSKRSFSVRLPAGVPTVVAGFTTEGVVGRWTATATDSEGRHGAYYAFAGDHYNSLRAGEHAICMGCHPGHTAISSISKPEKRR